MTTENERIEDWKKAPAYYRFPNHTQVSDISGHLTSNGGQALQYIARSTRLDGENKGESIEDLRKAERFIQKEILRLEEIARLKAEGEKTYNLTFTAMPFGASSDPNLRRLLFGYGDGSWEAMDGYISTDGIDAAADPIDVEPEDEKVDGPTEEERKAYSNALADRELMKHPGHLSPEDYNKVILSDGGSYCTCAMGSDGQGCEPGMRARLQATIDEYEEKYGSR